MSCAWISIVQSLKNISIVGHFQVNYLNNLHPSKILKWRKWFKVTIAPTHFSNLFFLRNRAKYIVLFLEPFERNFTSLLPLKDWTSGQTLIQNRAMMGNGFDTGFKSQINLRRCFQRTILMPKQSVTSTRY